MSKKQKNAITGFAVSSFAYIISVFWIASDVELGMNQKAVICVLYFFIVGVTTAMTYDLSEN